MIKIANIQIAYQNRCIIQDLTERGRILKKAPKDSLYERIKADHGVVININKKVDKCGEHKE